ncbi:hypothetical protein ACLOJK_030389 [Asimina triloba]
MHVYHVAPVIVAATSILAQLRSSDALYTEVTGPTLVTVLEMVTEDFKFGIAIFGKFIASANGLLLGQTIGYYVILEMSELE